MNKVYLLKEIDEIQGNLPSSKQKLVRHVGVISIAVTAFKFRASREDRNFEIFELDDPELLNRIAKESEKK